MRAVACFILGLVAGYAATFFGWIAYADLFHVHDGDGGKIMGVAFTLAPLAGLIAGVVLAISFGRRRSGGSR